MTDHYFVDHRMRTQTKAQALLGHILAGERAKEPTREARLKPGQAPAYTWDVEPKTPYFGRGHGAETRK